MISEHLDLGIKGRTAIVCGSSKGLGFACATSLARAGVDVVLNGRSEAALETAAEKLRGEIGRPVRRVAADVTTPEGRAALLAQCPEPDILVTNAGGPPPGQFEDWDEAKWQTALNANMVAPIMLIRSTIGPMRKKRWGRILNITSSAVKAPIAVLGLSNGARTGLTGFVAGLARQAIKDGVTINNLLPGPFDTDRLRSVAASMARARNVSAEEAMEEMKAANPSGRVGTPEEFGVACAYLASAHAGFITGQNLLLDGGAYPGTL